MRDMETYFLKKAQEQYCILGFVSTVGYFYATQHLRSQVGEKYTAEEVMDIDNHGWGTTTDEQVTARQ